MGSIETACVQTGNKNEWWRQPFNKGIGSSKEHIFLLKKQTTRK